MVTSRILDGALGAGVFILAALACGGSNPGGSGTESRGPGYVSKAQLGEEWPLTVDEGELSCVGNAVTFTAPDGRVYAVNGTAKGRGIPPIDPIWKLGKLDGTYTPVERLSLGERQAVFAATVACEDEANREAEKQYPTDIKRQIAMSQRQTDECKERVRKEHKLTDAEAAAISTEGVVESWPPLTPVRVNIGPLIKRGLSLCQ